VTEALEASVTVTVWLPRVPKVMLPEALPPRKIRFAGSFAFASELATVAAPT
jgi:hypothetical protein